MYLGLSVIGLIVLGMRRCICKGELGGPTGGRIFSGILMILLWIAFVILVSLQVYDVIKVDIPTLFITAQHKVGNFTEGLIDKLHSSNKNST